MHRCADINPSCNKVPRYWPRRLERDMTFVKSDCPATETVTVVYCNRKKAAYQWNIRMILRLAHVLSQATLSSTVRNFHVLQNTESLVRLVLNIITDQPAPLERAPGDGQSINCPCHATCPFRRGRDSEHSID